MNNNLKLIIVAVASFSIGVAATYTYQSSELSDPVLTPRQKELQKIAIEAERRPFFPSPTQSTSTPLIENSQPEKMHQEIAESSFDYIKTNTAVRDFQKRLDTEGAKRFENIDLNLKANYRKRNYVLSKLDFFSSSNNLFFKASYSGPEIAPAKMVFFVRFFSCNSQGRELPQAVRPNLNNTCYSFMANSVLSGKWSYYPLTASFLRSDWLEDVQYVSIGLDEMGNFSKETNLLRAYVPMPDDGGLIRFLRYKNNKFDWIDGGDLKWSETSAEEIRKYKKSLIPYFSNDND